VAVKGGKHRVCIIAGVMEKFDAASEAVIANMAAAASLPIGDVEVRIYCQSSSIADSRIFVVGSVQQLIAEEFFQTADIIIHHFSIYNDLHFALGLAPRGAYLIVQFYGVTPPQFMPTDDQNIIHESFVRQNFLLMLIKLW
jgi:hypothetical protein